MQAFQCSQYEWWSCGWLSAAAIRKVGERIRRHTERDALKKKKQTTKKRVHMAFGVCGMMFNPQCQVKEQVPNFAAEVHPLTNVGWAWVGEDAQSLRLCEVGLPVSFYFKPTGDLFFFFARLSQSANKEAVFFFFAFIMRLPTQWCWIGSQSLNISTFFFAENRASQRCQMFEQVDAFRSRARLSHA